MPRLGKVQFEETPYVEPYLEDVTKRDSSTVRELDLRIRPPPATLRLFQTIFPNISVLRLSCRGVIEGLFLEIFEHWPQLVELELTRPYYDPVFLRNSDASFCGIHEEEAELLSQKDEDFLKKVHIVPIRNCILTMQGQYRSDRI